MSHVIDRCSSVGSPAASLIIAVYEQPHFLEKVLLSVENQSNGDIEIIVADDGSGQSIKSVVERFSSHFRYPLKHVWHDDKGFRKTVIVNRAASESSAEYLIFIDGDCMLHHRFVERHVKRRCNNRVLSGRRVMFDDELTRRVSDDDVRRRRIERPTYWWRHAGKIDRWRGLYMPYLFGPRNRSNDRYEILGCNFSIFKQDFYRVNGYDERIIGRGLEDNNLHARLVNAGIEVNTVSQEALQYHFHHSADPIPHSDEFIDSFKGSTDVRTPYGIVKDEESA